MNCFVRIASSSGGEEHVFSSDGTFHPAKGGFIVTYSQEDDEVRLNYSAEIFTMERRGKTCLASEFRRGQTTEMRLFAGENVGTIPVFTDVLHVSTEGFRVILGYHLHFEHGDMPFLLKIFISEGEHACK